MITHGVAPSQLTLSVLSLTSSSTENATQNTFGVLSISAHPSTLMQNVCIEIEKRENFLLFFGVLYFLILNLPSSCPLLSSCSLHFPPLTILLLSIPSFHFSWAAGRLTARDNSRVCRKDEPTYKLDLVGKKKKNLNLSFYPFLLHLCHFSSVHLSSSAKPLLSPFLSCPLNPTLLTSFTPFSFFFHALPHPPLCHCL